MSKRPRFFHALRVYYEDTDSGGVVYYANYLRFLERARTELVRTFGVSQQALLDDDGIAFAVRSASIDYLKPARLDDELQIITRIESLGRAQVVFDQQIERNGEILVTAKIRVACLDMTKGKAAAMPKSIHEKFKELQGTHA